MLIPLALSLMACTTDQDDTGADPGTTSSMPYCEETETALERDEESPLGFAASALLDALPISQELDLSWDDGAADTLSWAFSPDDASVRYVDSVAVYPDTGGAAPAIAVICIPYVAVDGTLDLVSGDGRLDEALSVTLSMSNTDDVGSPIELSGTIHQALDGLSGTLDLDDFVDPSSYDSASLWLDSAVSSTGAFSGEVSAQTEATDGKMAWAELHTLAWWGDDWE